MGWSEVVEVSREDSGKKEQLDVDEEKVYALGEGRCSDELDGLGCDGGREKSGDRWKEM